MEVLQLGGDSQMTTPKIHRSERVLGPWREVSGTQPPGLLINKFMYEEEWERLLEGFQSVTPPSLLLSHFHCKRQNKITPRQWIIRKFMKRDECDGALHEIPMREALQRSKCYILISTVTLCYSHCSPEGHIMDRVWTHSIMGRHWHSQLWDASTGRWTGTRRRHAPASHRHRDGRGCQCHLCADTLCAYLVTEGGQRKCVHDSDTVVIQSGWVNFPCASRS